MEDKKQSDGKLIMMLFANTELQISIIEEVGETSFYNKEYKKLLQNIQRRNELIIEGLFKRFKDYGARENEVGIYFNKTVEACNLFKEAVKNSNVDRFIELMKAVRDGELMIFDENKHSKIAKQLKKLEI